MAPVNVLYVDNLREGYVEICRRVLQQGERVSPRGMDTYELLAPTIVLRDPRDALPLGVNRGVNLRIAAVEALQLMAGRAAPEMVLQVSENFRAYAEDNGTFWGNYGSRIGRQLHAALERLRADPDTRQAVITLWRSEMDLMVDGKRDYPCTVGFQFLLREGSLRMITTMRSNDVWRGLAYDAFQFTQLQINLAAMLEVPAGYYIHQPGSLHLYETDQEKVEQLDEVPTRGPIEEVGRPLVEYGYDGGEFLNYAADLLVGNVAPLTDAGQWYDDQLAQLR